MAENEDGQERTEEASHRRLEQARSKGQVPRSRELNTLVMLLVTALGLWILGRHETALFAQLLGAGLAPDRRLIFDHAGALRALGEALRTGLYLLLPFLAVHLVSAVLSSLALGGWNFSAEAIALDPAKLDPVKGIKRVFSLQGLVELGKALAKFLLVGATGLALFEHFAPRMLTLGTGGIRPALAGSGQILVDSFLGLSAVLVLVAAADVPFQVWNHRRQLRMTRQEVKDELKETEGRPEIKGKIKQMQREMAQRRMMQAVPEADVVVTNPTHYAVALRYDGLHRAAPVVVAKGKGLVAARIREIADEHGVPLFEAPPLARALYFTTEIDDEVPAALYMAVAQVLAYVYQLQTATAGGRPVPPRPEDLPVPEDLARPPGDRNRH